eukprot:scaffold31862_cov63-Phaeocystis_antarctica.AAC.16
MMVELITSIPPPPAAAPPYPYRLLRHPSRVERMMESFFICETGIGRAGKNATGAEKAAGGVATAPCGLCSLRTRWQWQVLWTCSSLGPDSIRAYRIFDQNAPVARSFRMDTASGVYTRHVAHGGVAEGKGGAFPHGDASLRRIADVLHANPRQRERPTVAHQKERLCGLTAI